MTNKNNKLAILLAILFEIILISTAIISIISRQREGLGLVILAIPCVILPFIITRIANKKDLVLPPNFQLILILFIFSAQYLGEINKFYIKLWWWDLLLHIVFGSYVVIIALYLMQGIIRKEEKTTNQRFTLFTVIFAFSFSTALGTLWEMFEFVGDFLFKVGMVKGGLEDTSTDILANIVAAFVTSIKYYHHKL